MCRHMYNWNIVDCDVIQPKMNLNKKFIITSLAKIGFKYNEFVENAQNEESAIYFKGNKFGEEVPIKKNKQVHMYDKYCTGVEEGVVTGGGAHVCPPPPLSKVGKGGTSGIVPPPPPLLDSTFVLISFYLLTICGSKCIF